jgi:hypothetical protein
MLMVQLDRPLCTPAVSLQHMAVAALHAVLYMINGEANTVAGIVISCSSAVIDRLICQLSLHSMNIMLQHCHKSDIIAVSTQSTLHCIDAQHCCSAQQR